MATTVAQDPHEALAVVARRFTLQTLDSVPQSRPPMAVPVSIALHALVIAALIVIPALTASELPAPTAAVHAYFVQPAAEVPPPPPPPPAAKAATQPAEVKPLKENAFVAPIEIPDAAPNKSLDLGVEGGMPGGVEGGVEGGVVGGVVGGLPAAPPPPVGPVRVGGVIKEPRKIKDVAPEYPAIARRAHLAGIVIIDAVIGPDGRVTDARVLRGVPMLDEAALAAVRQWAYTPTLLGGVPVPLEMTVTVSFRLK
jgi:periplasmic protein TonB